MYDEQAEQDKFISIVGGIKRADRLQQIWSISYPGFGKTKEENFSHMAIGEKFSKKVIKAFMELR